MEGRCPGCGELGEVGAPCPEGPCQRFGFHPIPLEYAGSGDEPTLDRNIGQFVGDFLVVAAIASGGFGKVYLALQRPLFRLKGALKLLDVGGHSPDRVADILEKFRSEAEAMADLNHPNIVRLIKYGQHRDEPYLVMEFVDGARTLGAELSRQAVEAEELDTDFVHHVIDQLVDGLTCAHEHAPPIVHRDIKPDNIMLQTVTGNPHHVRIIDFGLAKFIEGDPKSTTAMGTPAYMAPEQITRKAIGPWTDVYALGAVAYQMLAGRKPFAGSSVSDVLARKLDDEYDPVAILEGSRVEPAMQDVLRRALAIDPSSRYPSVTEFRKALLAADSTRGKTGPDAREPRVNPLPWAIVGILAAAMLIIFGLTVVNDGDPEPESGHDVTAKVDKKTKKKGSKKGSKKKKRKGLVGVPGDLIKVGGYGFAPYVEWNKKQGYHGLTLNLIEKLNELKTRWSFQFVPTTSEDRYKDFQGGRFDALFFESKAWEWAKYEVVASKRLAGGSERYLARREPGRDESYFGSLTGKRIVGFEGYHYDFADGVTDPVKLAAAGIQLEVTKSHEENVRRVLDGRADVTVVSDTFLKRYLAQNPRARSRLLVSKRADQVYNLSILIRPNLTFDRMEVNKLLESLETKGLLAVTEEDLEAQRGKGAE